MKKIITCLTVLCLTLCIFSGCAKKIPFENLVYKTTQNITKVVVDVDNAKVVFAVGNDSPYIEYQQNSQQKINISENGSVLTIKDSTWLHIGGTDEIPTITVYLNGYNEQNSKYQLDLSISNGSLTVKEDIFSVIEAEVDNGKITVENVNLSNLECEVSNGAIEINNVTTPNCNARLSNGKISADNLNSDSAEFSVDVGSIDISLVGTKEDYKISVDTDLGSSNVSSTQTGSKELCLEVDIGSVTVDFLG